MELPFNQLTSTSSLVKFNRDFVSLIGEVMLPISHWVNDYYSEVPCTGMMTIMVKFLVVDVISPYNVILR